jgi:hypothetical protein
MACLRRGGDLSSTDLMRGAQTNSLTSSSIAPGAASHRRGLAGSDKFLLLTCVAGREYIELGQRVLARLEQPSATPPTLADLESILRCAEEVVRSLFVSLDLLGHSQRPTRGGPDAHQDVSGLDPSPLP